MEPVTPMPDLLTIEPDLADGSEPWTRREILQQPQTLHATQALLYARRSEIEAFLSPLLLKPEMRVILAGAGTSAFIGECLAPVLARETGARVEAVPTTDIVSAPDVYLEAATPTLLVSFGRSGNSPESLAAVELADARVDDIHHLIITCNPDGALGCRERSNALIILLPEATHDHGFAMTSSFSAMVLAALSSFCGIADFNGHIDAIADAVAQVAAASEQRLTGLAREGFSRVVYLGSGLFRGLAHEAALKLLELSDGALVSLFETTVGFRHGPKTIVNDETLVLVFMSNDPLTRAYDCDMIDELRSDDVAGAVIAISAQGTYGDTIAIHGMQNAPDCDLLFPFIVPAQLFAFHLSQHLGLNPDQPNAAGTVNRVVQGVRIHTAAE